MTQNHALPTVAERAAFDSDGYHVIRGLLSADAARHYRLCINRAFELPKGELENVSIDGATFTLADGMTTIADFWPVLFNKHLLDTVRALIGDEIRYAQHSDLHINLHGGRYHRDSACRDFGVGVDWDEIAAPYKVLRVAIYLSDHRDSGSSIVVLPGSHRRESRLHRLEYVIWNRLRIFARRRGFNDALPHLYFSRPKITLKTRPGDCVIIDQRLLHAGGVLHGPTPKHSMFLAYGADNHHTHNHRAFFLKRPTYSPDIPPALRDRLVKAELLLE